jgi:type IV pilus assembly protein PilF
MPAVPSRPLLSGLVAALALLAGCAASMSRPAEPDSAQRRAQARLALASAYFEHGQAETALEEVDRALAADPSSAAAHDLRGLAQASLGQVAAAQASFERALQLDPRNADAMHNFGWFQCQQRRWDESQRWLERALAQPGYRGGARSWLALGVCQARAQRWEAAESSLVRAMELEPANAAATLNLAEVLLRRGDAERARAQLQRVGAAPAQADAATLWLAARIEHRLGRHAAVEALGRELRQRYPQAPQTLALDQGRFDD